MARCSMVMPSSTSEGAARLQAVKARIAKAAEHAGRKPDSIALLAVSKGQTASAVAELAALGLTDFGENYLQEALQKIAALRTPLPQLSWHFIGQLQSNKTRAVAENFAWVHTVDRLKIAERLSEQRPFHAAPLQLCIQVKLAEEQSKGGVAPTDLPALLQAIAILPRLRLRGLMAIPPAESTEAAQRRWFSELRGLFAAARSEHPQLDTLSMGMSGDLEAAILEGSTMVRIGTALFGERLQSSA
jgi:pyridoxal phosphate enzyme (YggS family)